MTDEDFKAAQAYDLGCYFSHPFTDTCLIELSGEDVEEEENIEEDQDSKDLFSLKDIEELMSTDTSD